MLTYFLGSEEVNAYALDLVSRLRALGPQFPLNWFGLGVSGRVLIDNLLDLLPDREPEIEVGIAGYNRATAEINFSNVTALEDMTLGEGPVLILDAAVHSGKTMLALVQKLQNAGAKEIMTYTLVLKRSAVIVPTFFGIVIDDKDRIYFELEELPNNRLANPAPNGVLRSIVPGDLDRPIAELREPFAGLTIGDLIYERDAHNSHVYIFEHRGEIVGFILFRKDGVTLFIDAWFAAKRYDASGRKMKIGHALFRWAETWGRSTRCERIELWAFEDAMRVYNGMSFKPIENDWRNLGEGKKYKIMERKILYNIKDSESDEDRTERH